MRLRKKQCAARRIVKVCLAEAVRFELTMPCGTPVFKTGAFNHSATLPGREL
jgi:hypothetical protein